MFLTGQPGVGKTTLLKLLVNDFMQKQSLVFGFYTEEVRNGSSRVGFDVVSLTGARFSLARIDDQAGNKPRIGRYSVNVTDFNRNLSILLPIQRNKPGKYTVFIDEIGKMELLSNDFKKRVTKLLNNSSLQVIGTLPQKKGNGIAYVENIKQRTDVKVFDITYENRNTIIDEIRNCFLLS